MEIYMSKIRDLREDRDKTQEEIANYLGIKQTVYSRYETGALTNVDKNANKTMRILQSERRLYTGTPQRTAIRLQPNERIKRSPGSTEAQPGPEQQRPESDCQPCFRKGEKAARKRGPGALRRPTL